MSILSIKEVSKQYSGHLALDNVSLEIPEGKIYGLLGPNGAGKTTLIRIINHITAPDTGSVQFMGHPLVADDVVNIGYLPEERGLYKKMKVGEQALFFARLKGLSTREANENCIIGSNVSVFSTGGERRWRSYRRVWRKRCSLSSPCSTTRSS